MTLRSVWTALLLILVVTGPTLKVVGDAPHTDALGVQLTQFGEGDGPRHVADVYHLLDEANTHSQSNAIAFDQTQSGRFEVVTLRCQLRVEAGGDGGAFIFLNTAEYGKRGPAPFLGSWVEPNLSGTFAVGIDVHNPPTEEPFGPWGNYQGLPEREVSLHWDGREIVKRVAADEFRGEFVALEIVVKHVVGGAAVTVRLAGAAVYDGFFVSGMLPYESRLVVGAGTRSDVATTFDVKGVEYTSEEAAKPRRTPVHVEVFHHVMTDNSKTAFESEVALPPANWAFGRVIMTIDIHDGGQMWDEWDRNGEVTVWDKEGKKRGIVPFITSYRTPCHWKVDVSHFRPYLSDLTKFEIRAGTTFYKNRGYAMSVSLDFYHGTPEVEPYRVVPVWVGTASYKSEENHFQDFFEPHAITIPRETVEARLFMTTTGHSQVGEFTPSERAVVWLPDRENTPGTELRFPSTLWRADCYLNPNRPQFGTWKYSRAGWAPGDVVHPWWIDLTTSLVPGQRAELRYESQPYDFSGRPQKPTPEQIHQASHVVRSYLILWRRAGESVSAPVVLVTNVADGSNAAKAGLQRGDYLARYDGQLLDSVADLRAALQAAVAAEKKTIVVVVFRGSERLEVEMPTGTMGVNLTVR